MTLTPLNSRHTADPLPAAAVPSADRFRQMLWAFLRAALSEYSILILAALYFLVMWPLLPELASAENLSNFFISMLPLLALAIGQTVVLISGGIDLSMTAVIAAASVLSARIANDANGLLAHHSTAIPAAFLAALLLGATVPCLTLVSVIYTGLPAQPGCALIILIHCVEEKII